MEYKRTSALLVSKLSGHKDEALEVVVRQGCTLRREKKDLKSAARFGDSVHAR